MSRLPTIGIVIPVYNEEVLLELLHDTLSEILNPLDIQWCAYYVDDGSHDRSLEILQDLQTRDPEHLTIVQLSRNWGHQPAITAGLAVVDADATLVMDADMQDPPTLIPTLIEKWQEGAMVVEAVRLSRAEGGLRGLLFRNFYGVFNWLTDNQFAMNSGVFSLMDRTIVEHLREMPERNRYLPGMRSYLGYPTAQVEYHREERAAGEPKQSLWNLMRYGADAAFSFSVKPLRLSTVFGLFLCSTAILAGFVAIGLRLSDAALTGDLAMGLIALGLTVVFLSGTQLASIGILGEYVGRTFDEAKARPFFVIQKVHDHPPVQRRISQLPP